MELSKKHIIYTLGIPVSNVTYINEELRLTILQEQLLYETFLDTIKDFAKDKLDKAVNTITDWKDAAAVFAKILASPELLKDFLKPLLRLVNTHLQTLYKVLEKIKLSSVVEKIKKLVEKVSDLDGWKQLLILIALGGIALYAATKLPLNGIEAYIAKIIGDNLIETIISKLFDWKSYIGYIGPIVGGVTIIYTLLKPLLTEFSAALKSDNPFATKLIKEEEKMRNRFQKLAGIKEAEETQTLNIPGTFKPLLKQISPSLNVPVISRAIGKISQGKEDSLTLSEKNEILDIFVLLMKETDASVFQKFVSVFKQIK